MLERLLDVRQVVHRYAERVGDLPDLGGRQPGDLELVGAGPLHGGAFGKRAVQVVHVGRADPHPLSAQATQDLADAGVGDEAATSDDDDAVGDQLHLAHQVTGDQHGAALVGEAAQQRTDPSDPVEVEAVDRFVEEEDLRVAQQRGSDPEPLPHAQGVALDPPAGRSPEADLVDHLLDPSEADAVGAGPDAQVCPSGTAGVHRAGVEQRPDLAQWRGELDVPLGVDGRDPGSGPIEAHDHPHRRRLGGPVRAEEAGDLPCRHVEREVVDGAHGAVPLGESSHADHGSNARSDGGHKARRMCGGCVQIAAADLHRTFTSCPPHTTKQASRLAPCQSAELHRGSSSSRTSR
jgi:hypothetical protein